MKTVPKPGIRLVVPAVILHLLAAVALWSAEPPKLPEGATEYMVPMRDGVKLATNVFLPEGGGPWPVVLTRTPYGKDSAQRGNVKKYAEAGYARVVQDCRGKFRSEGAYHPYEDDMEDGYDTVEWLAKQKFCNGKVGMSGASAMGITSNLAACTTPPHLVAAFVVVAPQSIFAESRFIGGVFKEKDTTGWFTRQGAEDQVPAYRKRVLMDDRWKQKDLVHHLDGIKIPIYNVGGWYDIFTQGNLNNFMYLQNQGSEGARGRQKLLMGPFGHGALSGDLDYPADRGLLGGFDEEVRWFDYWLKGKDNGIMKERPVKYFMMASAKKDAPSRKMGFRTSDTWPPKSTPTKYYLGEKLSLSTDAPKAKESSTAYKFDPANPAPTVGGGNLTFERGPMDQRKIGDRPDYLRFQTAPLEKDLAIAGKLDVALYASTDGPDTDFDAKLVDVYPDGYEALVVECPIRARYRNGRNPEDVKMMTPGEPTRMTINLWSTAIIFEKGHRIALHVTSSSSPRFEVNPNTGEAPGKSEKPPRVATNTIYHDAAHPTAVILPVLSE